MSEPVYSIEDAGDLVERLSRPVDPTRVTVFSTFRDELGFCPAFFDHYRRIGVEQFLIIDDGSVDGTGDWLAAQPDTCVLHMRKGYGEEIAIALQGQAPRRQRAGIYYKIALPHLWFDGQFVTYVDADEFLILPPGVTSLREIEARLAAAGETSAVASVVEFFPRDAAGLQGALPQDFAGLIAAYPWFQPEPLVRLRPGQEPELTGQSKTARLFARYGIEPRLVRRGWHRLWMPARERKRQAFQKSPRHKTPIVLRSRDSRLIDTHNANRPPSAEVLLTVAHFVFTAQFADKIARATAWGAHANAAAKYRYYAELLAAMQGVPDGFLDAESVRYEGPEQLIDAGLMRW